MKLQAKDFRIGNLINCNGDIRPIDLQDLQNMEEGLDFYKAVSLDEEWLLKFGFKLKDKGNGGYVIPTRESLNEYFYCSVTGIVALISELNGYKDFIIRGIQYAHQLQNLFYTISGKELELK